MNLNNSISQIKNNICNNCGKQGHLFHHCKLPITSYGIILFKKSNKGIQYLMIRRKDSFGYIDFLRGKYIQNNVEHLQNMFNEMSIPEKELIRISSFNILWKQMWGDTYIGNQYKSEELASQKKFESLKNGISIKSLDEIEVNQFKKSQDDDLVNNFEFPKINFVSVETLINNSTTAWSETEWEFPKGRRNYQEKDLDCALREFEEETGISKKNVKIVENIMPFEEIFIGSNHKSYKNKYFLGCLTNNDIENNTVENEDRQFDKMGVLNNFQKSEVSKIEWKTIEECLESIRPYNLEKKQLIININKVLQEYRLY
jgi:8-oxo-dGTP pyrophosphatase MutT (NUDIX family)